MAAGDLITTAYQWELNGLLMGPGTLYQVAGAKPWAKPDIRPGEAPRALQDGLYPGQDYLGGRLVPMSIAITPQPTQAADVSARQALVGAWSPPTDGTTVPLIWQEADGTKYLLNGKPRLADPEFAYWQMTQCFFIATDPRIFVSTLQTASTGLATIAGGVASPTPAPVVAGTSGTGATMSCPNTGTRSAPWTATFVGPLVAPTLTFVSNSVFGAIGKSLVLSGASLAAGDTLVVDSASKTILFNGASRYSWLSGASQWFELLPGTNSLNLTGASGAGTVTVAWRSAFL